MGHVAIERIAPCMARLTMLMQRVLITGGAGFIGSHLADELLHHGYVVRVLDCLLPQVHGPERRRPSYLAPEVELAQGDVRDPEAVHRALRGVDVVYHLAARVATPWRDDEALFTAGEDYLVASDPAKMRRLLRAVVHDRALAAELARHGRQTSLARHTCAHRVDELFTILTERGVPAAGTSPQELS